MAGLRTRFYLDRDNKQVSGVCAGLAEYFDVEVIWIRLAALASLFISGGITLLAYFYLAHSTPERPDKMRADMARQDRDEREFWTKVRRNPHATARSVRARFRDLDRRLAAAETYLTSPDKRLAREIERLR